ncbi:HdeD family acid-resistance protein [Frigoribacterium sp. 2-23]|uniref:HdeD family acid-resistance protein n=1 Tax=Frigoribacterium sp. 2-23 TaxID=3415006 RepID=UPI003C6EDF1C
MPAAPSGPVPPEPARRDPSTDSRYWPVLIARAVPLLVLGAVITFSSDHSPRVGLLAFGAAALVAGAIIAVGSALRLAHDPSTRTIGVLQGAVGIVVGALALVFSGGGLPVLVALVSGFAIVTGALELVTGLRRRRRSPLARDWIGIGVITLVLGAVFVAVPPDYSEQLGGIEKVSGELTSSIVLVGILGAYGALVGVFLVIAGLSLKWGTGHPPMAEERTTSGVSTS